jgi:hypothetical protein
MSGKGRQAGKKERDRHSEAGSLRQVCKQSLTLIRRQAWMKVVTGRQKLPGRGRYTGWQWQEQRGRLADSPQGGRQGQIGRDRLGDTQAGKQAEGGKQWQAATQAEAEASRHAEAVKRQAGMKKQTGLHVGTWAAKEGQVGRQAGR